MNEFNTINCDKEFCFICKKLITEDCSSSLDYSEKSLYEIVGSVFSHILYDEIYISKICAECQVKLREFDEFQSKANEVKNELINIYESRDKFNQEIEQLDIDLIFKPIELEVINVDNDLKSANESKTEEDLSEDFKKIIEEKGIKYDLTVFQRVFGEDTSNDEKDIESHKQRKKFFCDECKIEIKTFNNFLIHKADHEKQNFKHDDEHALERHDDKYNCFCGKIFLYKLSYTQHLKIHNNIREYHCNYEMCDFKAFNSTHLARHIRAKHTKEKNHSCVYCGRKFAEKYNMNSHIRKQHLGDKFAIESVY